MTKQEIESRAHERAAAMPITGERQAESIRNCLLYNREMARRGGKLQPGWVSELYARTQEIQLAAWGRKAPAKRRGSKVAKPRKADRDWYSNQRKYHAREA